MVKVVARNRAGSYQRLVVMTETEYEELRAASLLLQSKKTGQDNSLVEKYLDSNAHPELSMSERLALFNRVVAREEAGRQFTNGQFATSTTTKSQGMDAPTTKPQLTEVQNTTTTATQAAAAAAATAADAAAATGDVKNGTTEVQEQDKPDTTLPNVKVPVLQESKFAALHEILQASGTVSVDKLGLVYINGTLLDAKSNYFNLMRSLFVNSKNDAKLAGRSRFLEHLHKLGVSAQHVVTSSAKSKLDRLALPPKQGGKGSKTQRKTSETHTKSRRPPGKRPKVLLMYR